MNKTKTPIVSVRDVSFSYGYETVLKNISLDIYPQDYLAIIGPNGGGKTTLVKIMLGLLRPGSGSVTWSEKSGQRQIGYVPQFATFERDFPLTVRDVVLMGRLSGKLWRQRISIEDRDVTTEILYSMGLTALSEMPEPPL